jgi:hypothetical protein
MEKWLLVRPAANREVCFVNDLAATNRWLEEHCVGSWIVEQAGQPGSDRTSVGGMRITMKASAECDRRGRTGALEDRSDAGRFLSVGCVTS